jgi:putative membrane protein
MTMQQDLALQRTRLANERTLLAYVRTFMGFLGLGVAVIAVFDSTLSSTIGAASIIAGAIVMIIGLTSYFRNYSTLRKEADEMRTGTGSS